MKDALKNYGADLAEQIVAKFASPEMRELIERTKAASDEDTGSFRVVGTSENLDRYEEVISIAGWDTAHYLNNPVILWGHDHSRLIGMTTSIEIVDGKMVFNGKFAPTDEGQEKRRLYDAGFLRATSVGFIERERQGNLITKAELLELSFVSVPANPFALSLAMEKGLNTNELVTKGFMHVEKEAEEETVTDTVPESEVQDGVQVDAQDAAQVDEAAQAAIEGEERSFSTKQLSPVIEGLKAALVALEALGTRALEPEGEEDVVEEAETDAVKSYLALKSLFQSVDTTLGDVLAELRHVGGRQ